MINGKKGFTLIELLLAIMIVTIVALVITSKVVDNVKTNKKPHAVEQLQDQYETTEDKW